MLPGSALRRWYFLQLRKAVQTVNSILMTTTETDATTYRDGGQGWTALEVLCHLRDYDEILLNRARSTVEQDRPDITGPNAEALATERAYNRQPLRSAYDQWAERRETMLAYLEGLDDATWAREAIHPRQGPMSLQDQLAFIAYHDLNHIEQMARILAEKKAS